MWGTISPKRKFHTSAEELRRMFIDDGMTISEIASKLGLHRRTVANWLRAYEIRLDPAEVRRRQTRHGSDVWNYRGYKTTSRGYIYVRRSEHPAANRDGYVLEHRLTVEAILQRYLLSGEQIHHLNFVKADNDIENLVLFPSAATHTNFHKYMERVAVGLLGIAPMPAPFSIAAPIFYKQEWVTAIDLLTTHRD
jgi:hypothetical protein